jgi:lysyl-tRNA synthetase, class I
MSSDTPTQQAINAAQNSKAWPFIEARNILKRLNGKLPEKGYVLFETGYGPSGLPHIGTFGEVSRTTMVRRAFEIVSGGMPTKLIAFSDDMDGLRKVPDNIPNKDIIAPHLGKPLTVVPDPFGTHNSFGEHNNARLQAFLDGFGFEYEFRSATKCYKEGLFDDTLLAILKNYDEVINIVLPTLGAERQATYSPFLPVCPDTGRVLQTKVVERHPDKGTIVYENEDGKLVETTVTGGAVKCQWKVDWAMRWTALGVNYEMAGKDLIESQKLSSRICRALGGTPPVDFTYELFLDDKGEKISKSKGNGLSMEDWLRYAPPETLSYFMFQKPKTAKRLHFDVIPKAVDEYLSHVQSFEGLEDDKKIDSPAWHVDNGHPTPDKHSLSFNIILNLVSVCHTEDTDVIWNFIKRYNPDASAENSPMLDQLVGRAINYYQDFVKPNKKFRTPTDGERAALTDLRNKLATLPLDMDGSDVQSEVFAIGKEHNYENLRDWFGALYETLLGQDTGPRMGSFFALYGLKESCDLIDKVLAGENLDA